MTRSHSSSYRKLELGQIALSNHVNFEMQGFSKKVLSENYSLPEVTKKSGLLVNAGSHGVLQNLLLMSLVRE